MCVSVKDVELSVDIKNANPHPPLIERQDGALFEMASIERQCALNEGKMAFRPHLIHA